MQGPLGMGATKKTWCEAWLMEVNMNGDPRESLLLPLGGRGQRLFSLGGS
jgi:hypothetical protein